jgi:hypothetical protein
VAKGLQSRILEKLRVTMKLSDLATGGNGHIFYCEQNGFSERRIS